MDNKQNFPYVEQYHRMKRWYQWIKNPGSNSEFLDDIGSAFFMTCFHLKDWILNDGSLGVEKRKKVEKFVNDSPLLEMCRSICDNSKHLKCDDPKVIDGLKVKKMSVMHNLWGPGAAYATIHGFIEIGEDAYEISSLAELCMKEWDKFFIENAISIPTEPTSTHFDLPSKLKKKFEKNNSTEHDRDESVEPLP